MSRHGKVIVAMSGGVDSSVAACLLHEQGYDCVGVFLRVGEHAADGHAAEPADATPGRLPLADTPRRLRHGCCSLTDSLDARAIAARLGIPFYVLNFEADFREIVAYFTDEYARGRTPNPCVRCNIDVKFGRLLRYADMLDAQYVATGHYARILQSGGRSLLARSSNRAKDQSYVLFGIARQSLPRCLFPLGEISDKAEVRRIAARLGLAVHDKPDSQELCFIPDNDYARFVQQRNPQTRRGGAIVDSGGVVVGAHEGISNFTVGQRRGLRVAAGRPLYVTRLDVAENIVHVGDRAELLASGLVADGVNWLVDPPPPGQAFRAAVKIRHQHTPASASVVRCADERVSVAFDEPQLAVAPGQAAVWYGDDGVVLGGGWIAESAKASEAQEAAR